MKAWRIVDWVRHYELNDQGRRVSTPERARAGPLGWVALPVKGRDHSPGYRDLITACGRSGRRLVVVWGLWCKLLELVAAQPKERRCAGLGGWVLDGNGRPAAVEDIAKWTAFRPSDIERALTILCGDGIRWLAFQELPERLQVPTGPDRNLHNPTRPDPTQPNKGEEGNSPVESFSPLVFARSVEEALQLGKGDAKQTQADLRDFKRVGEAILAGKMGDRPATAAQACLTTALEMALDKTVHNKAGCWLTWARAQIKA